MPKLAHKPPKGALNFTDAAAYLGISTFTLRRLFQKNEIRCVRPTAGRTGRFKGKQGVPVYFFIADLDSYIARIGNIPA